jgi:hypothetical protein
MQWKMLAALGRPAFKKMFSATRNSITMDAYLRDKKIVLVKGAEQALGKEGMRIFLLFILGQYYAAAKRRDPLPQHKRSLAMFVCDEAWMVLQSKLVADILVELRKYNCAFVSANQLWSQVAEDVRSAVLGATAIKAVGALQHNDATQLGREMFSSPEQIRSLKPFSGPGTHTEWLFHFQGMQRSQVVRLPYGILEQMPKQKAPPPQERPSSSLLKPEHVARGDAKDRAPLQPDLHNKPASVTKQIATAVAPDGPVEKAPRDAPARPDPRETPPDTTDGDPHTKPVKE